MQKPTSLRGLEQHWTDYNRVALGLWPLSQVFQGASRLRRLAYQWRFAPVYQAPVPVIIVGNISVGGTGKTPLVAWIAQYLKQAGYQPGIVSRGYRGQAQTWPQGVTADSDPWLVGDEPVWLAQASACPVVVAPKRAEAVTELLARFGCDVVLADDGLQHYALARDIEIAVVDGERGVGNGFCLPAGPLREPVSRLRQVDFMVINGDTRATAAYHSTAAYTMQMRLESATHLLKSHHQSLSAWAGQTVHAVAGIGFPQRFFQALRAHGLTVIEHPFADHHRFTQQDLRFGDSLPVLMTSKDAVKCQLFTSERDWCVPVTLDIPLEFGAALLQQLQSIPQKDR